MAKTKNYRTKSSEPLLKKILFVFLAIFVAVGAYVIVKSFAATPNTCILEAEAMTHPKTMTSYKDIYASGGKFISTDKNDLASRRKLTGKITTGSVKGWRFAVLARALSCHGTWPQFSATLSGNGINTTMKINAKTARGWTNYEKTGLDAPANKTYNVKITYNIHNKWRKGHYCNSSLAIDVVQLKPQPVEITNVSSTVKKKKATISATLNNHNNAVSYYVEYGTSTSYGSVTASQAMKPSADPKDIKVTLSKFLEKNTTYHYRVCATNGDEVDCSGDYTFTTDGKGKGKDNGCKKDCGGTTNDTGGGGHHKHKSGMGNPSNGSGSFNGTASSSTITGGDGEGGSGSDKFYSCDYGDKFEYVQDVGPDGSMGPKVKTSNRCNV